MRISIEKYNKIMSRIIGKNMDIDKTLIALLNEANKYTIKHKPKAVSIQKCRLTETRRKCRKERK